MELTSLVRRARRFQGTAVDQGNPQSFESLGNDASLWRTSDVLFATGDKSEEANEEGQETEQVECPEALVFLHEHCAAE